MGTENEMRKGKASYAFTVSTFHVQSVQLLRVGIKQATRSSAAAHWLSSPHKESVNPRTHFQRVPRSLNGGSHTKCYRCIDAIFLQPFENASLSVCHTDISAALIPCGMLGWTHLPLTHPEGSHVPLTTGGEKRP